VRASVGRPCTKNRPPSDNDEDEPEDDPDTNSDDAFDDPDDDTDDNDPDDSTVSASPSATGCPLRNTSAATAPTGVQLAQ
jgi:hypothetical protein